MGAASSSQINKWDDLFQTLTRPDDLRAYLTTNLSAGTSDSPQQTTLRTQVELLTGTLQVDRSLLKVSEVAESFDTATFCLGQLVSHEPQLMSELPFATTVVDGLASALRKGWHVHHGVGKFAANALTILCICEEAVPAVREHAIDQFLAGLLEWLRDDVEPQDVEEVCGCNCGCAALSATCWLERLLGKPDALLERMLRSHARLVDLVRDLFAVVSRRDGNPFALTRLLCVPAVHAMIFQQQPELAAESLTFVTFGLIHFDNPMFTEDAVQALLALLRDADGAALHLLAHRASLPLLEALATAACYLPSSLLVLEALAASPAGRLCVYSLAAALSSTSADAPADATAAAPAAAPAAVDAAGAADGPGAASSSDGSGRSSSSLDVTTPRSPTLPPASPHGAGAASPDNDDSCGERASPLRAPGGGLIARMLLEAGAFAGKLRALWLPHRLAQHRTASARLAPAAPVLPGDPPLMAAHGEPAVEGVAGGESGAGATAGATHERVSADDSSDDDDGGADDAEAPGARADAAPDTAGAEPAATGAGPDGFEPGGVEAWDQFRAQLLPTCALAVAGADETCLPPIVISAPPAPAAEAPTGDAPPRALTSASDSAAPADPDESAGRAADRHAAPPSPSAACSEVEAGACAPTGAPVPTPARQPVEAETVPTWPNARVAPDVVKAWVLLELLGFREGQERLLLDRMTLSDKRVWLARRLYREHHGGRVAEEEPLLFVECTRDLAKGAVIAELREQCGRDVGLGGDLSGTLEVHFKDENSAGSAVKREWFGIVSDAMLQPEARLLSPVAGGAAVRPLPMDARSAGHAQQLRDMEMLGRFLGLALLQQVTVGIRLHESVCRLLLRNGAPWDWDEADIIALDAALHAHKVRYVLDNPVDDLCLDFTDVLRDASAAELADAPGAREQLTARVELVPGGQDMLVTDANKRRYVDLVCAWRLFGCIEPQVGALLQGFHAAVPPAILSQLSSLIAPADLAAILAGEPAIDVDDWRRHCAVAGGMRRGSRAFRWFWRAVRSFGADEREQLLQFVTGSRRPPVGGFAHLQGFNGGVHKFTLYASAEPADSLPKAHACICTLDLPSYTSFAVMRRCLHTALALGSVGFDDAAIAGAASDGADDDDDGAGIGDVGAG